MSTKPNRPTTLICQLIEPVVRLDQKPALAEIAWDYKRFEAPWRHRLLLSLHFPLAYRLSKCFYAYDRWKEHRRQQASNRQAMRWSFLSRSGVWIAFLVGTIVGLVISETLRMGFMHVR